MLPDETVEHLDAAEVGQDQVMRRSERRLQPAVPVRRKVDRKAFPAQPARDEIANAGLVIYQKDASARLNRCHHAAALLRKRTSCASRAGSIGPAQPARWKPCLSTR